MTRNVVRCLLATVAVATVVGLPASPAHAGSLSSGGVTRPATQFDASTASHFAGMPSQSRADHAADPDNPNDPAGWGDMPGGVADRPAVRDLAVVNGTTVTPLISDGVAAPHGGDANQLTAVVWPVNLCRSDETPAAGHCYRTPNRVGITIGYNLDADQVGTDLGGEALEPNVTTDSVIDMTIALDDVGKSLRWSWINGDLLYWQTTALGTSAGTVRVKFHPRFAPWVSSWPDGNGCTATPIFNCTIASEDGETLTATMLLSLDNTLDPNLTGAVFATQNAISGYLAPGNGPQGPTLDIQAASTHTKWDGSPQLGTIEAFIPSAALWNIYGVPPADAAGAFAATRSGDTGSNAPPQYTVWNAAANGSQGLFMKVGDVTFSVPTYRVRGRLARLSGKATVRRTTTTVQATLSTCSRKTACRATVYNMSTGRSVALSNKAVTSRSLTLNVNAKKLRKGHRYLLLVRRAPSGTLLGSTLGTVR